MAELEEPVLDIVLLCRKLRGEMQEQIKTDHPVETTKLTNTLPELNITIATDETNQSIEISQPIELEQQNGTNQLIELEQRDFPMAECVSNCSSNDLCYSEKSVQELLAVPDNCTHETTLKDHISGNILDTTIKDHILDTIAAADQHNQLKNLKLDFLELTNNITQTSKQTDNEFCVLKQMMFAMDERIKVLENNNKYVQKNIVHLFNFEKQLIATRNTLLQTLDSHIKAIRKEINELK